MMSEMIMVICLILLLSQNSSFWSSLINVSLSGVFSYYFLKELFCGVYAFVFFMVFISGLLVLLVSVASLSTQEQKVVVSKSPLVLTVFMVIPFLDTNKISHLDYDSFSLLPFSMWIVNHPLKTISILVFILILGLMLTSKMILSFKSLLRSL